jgi:hypothetical protein
MNDEFRDTKDDILRAIATITMEKFMKNNLNENALFSNDLLEKNRNFVVKKLQDLILELHFEKRAPRINLQDLKTARVDIMLFSQELFKIFKNLIHIWEEWVTNERKGGKEELFKQMETFLEKFILSQANFPRTKLSPQFKKFLIATLGENIKHVKKYYEKIEQKEPSFSSSFLYKSYLSTEEINKIISDVHQLRSLLRQNMPTQNCVQELRLFSNFSTYISRLIHGKKIDQRIQNILVNFVDECSKHPCFEHFHPFIIFRLYLKKVFDTVY